MSEKWEPELSICEEFELSFTGEAEKYQSSRLGKYEKRSNLENGKISYYNKDEKQYLFWINTNGEKYWMVSRRTLMCYIQSLLKL